MDTNTVACQPSADIDAAERMRFQSFKLGNPVSTTSMKPSHRHARSHSRNLSVSSSVTGLSFSSSANSIKHMSETSPPSPALSLPAVTITSSAAKRSSHHRRRSSVSTRHESADMMGVSIAELPVSWSDENINIRDKDSVRRRALWALEGKPDSNSFSTVEIPDISTPEISKKFELPPKPAFPSPPVGCGYNPGLNNTTSKRDSFGKHLTSSTSVTELHTLVEEDEEEECKEDEGGNSTITSSIVETSLVESTSKSIVVNTTPTSPPRHRPVGLNLRPLSLTKENVLDLGSLQTPPSPNMRPGLKSLTLASPPNSRVLSMNSDTNDSLTTTDIPRRQSFTISSARSSVSPSKRPSLNLNCETNSRSSFSYTDIEYPKRRATVSHRSSTDVASGQFALPTPELTPTLQRHRSASTNSTGTSEWSLSETEQHFLYQAHTTLVQRISDLERALAASASRPQSVSCASDSSPRASISSDHSRPEETSDEILQLIVDLKAERDELGKDVEGWRVRVSDLDKQVGLLARRADLERRDAWVARERCGLLEREKKDLEEGLQSKTAQLQEVLEKYKAVRVECTEVRQECDGIRMNLERMKELEDHCERLKLALSEEKKKREELEISLAGAGLVNSGAFDSHVIDRPPSYVKSIGNRNFGFQSIDSEATDVDAVDQFQDRLKTVFEEREESLDEEDDGLAHYEDEQDDDLSIQGSSLGSLEDAIRATRPRTGVAVPISASLLKSSSPLPSQTETNQNHHRHHSLTKTWKFPKDAQLCSPVVRDIDRFFGCLEHSDDNSFQSDGDNVSLAPISDDNGRDLFSRSLQYDDDQFQPFLLPKNVGYEVPEEQPTLEVVVEEEGKACDDDKSPDAFKGEEVEGGIVFKFIPPDDSDESSELLTPSPGPTRGDLHIFELHEDDEDAHKHSPTSAPATPQSCKRKTNSPTPSAIPRAIALRTYTPTRSSPPTGLVSDINPSNAFTTPPSKRGSTMPSFIPQSRTPSPVNQAAGFVSSTPTRQPHRNNTGLQPSQGPTASIFNARTIAHRSGENDTSLTNQIPPADFDCPSAVAASLSPTSTAKLTFQSFANLIPSAFSWSPRTPQRADAPAALQDAEPYGRLSFGNIDRKINTNSKEKLYVSKEKQLEKLRSRLQEEDRSRRRVHGTSSPYGKCDDKFINM